MTSISSLATISSSNQALAKMHKASAEADSFEAILQKASENNDDRELVKACQDFESYFLQMMFREMRKTSFSSGEGIVPKSYAQEVFQDMLDEEYSKTSAETGGIGLANMLYAQLSKTK